MLTNTASEPSCLHRTPSVEVIASLWSLLHLSWKMLALLSTAQRRPTSALCKHIYVHIQTTKHITEPNKHTIHLPLHPSVPLPIIPIYTYRPGAGGNCTTQKTSCNACYFAKEERPLPSKCAGNLKRYKCAGRSGCKLEMCLKRWGNCVQKAFKRIYGKVCTAAALMQQVNCPGCNFVVSSTH